MKKILSLVFGLILLFSVTALGENQIELISGVYKEGREIEAGFYSFSCNSTEDGYCVVATFANEEHYGKFVESTSIVDGLKDNSVYYEIIHKGESCSIRIDNGYLLLIKYGEGVLSLTQLTYESKDDKESTVNQSYDALLLALKSTELNSGEKLMARLRYWAEEKGTMDAAIGTYESYMTAIGYPSDQAKMILLRAQAGEEIHPFHEAEYNVYNIPAEDNGLKDDTIFVCGTIENYISDGGKKNCAYGLIVQQEDGSKWLVYCAEKISGILIGKLWGSEPEQHVFEGYDGRNVMIYGKYLGFSDKYKLPVIDIVTYGGMLLTDENALIMTMTSDHNMRVYGGLNKFEFLIGAASCTESIEPYYGR